MKVFYQSSWATTVMRNQEAMEVFTVLNGMGYEASVYLKVDITSLIIKDARWEVFRSPGCDLARGSSLEVLVGTAAKKYSSRMVPSYLEPDITDMLVELIAEGVRCIIQAEPFMIGTRGYGSYQEYDNDMQKLYTNSCSCYSNIEPAQRIVWTDYMQERCVRPNNVFNRSKTFHFCTNSNGQEVVTASFSDSFHELLLTAALLGNGDIEHIAGSFIRGPEDTCLQGALLLDNLKGANLNRLTKKELNALIGGPCGCTHFVEIFWGVMMAWSEKSKLDI